MGTRFSVGVLLDIVIVPFELKTQVNVPITICFLIKRKESLMWFIHVQLQNE